ncbi:uncharacterized protein [Apostichopus japonicus]|uniref:uncharacterized protein n=1 Tax=Stichopus japonicus TaxID=307972 RepID=UPI003AB3E0F3
MDIKDEDSSAGIGLEFNTEDHNQFVAFDPVGNHDHLVIRSAGQIDMTTGSLVVPEATVTVEADDVGSSDEDKVGRTEGLEPMETLATVATGKTIVEVDPADEEDLYDDFRDTKKSPVSVNQSWFTGKHAKESLQEQGHSWRQGMWSKEEVAILMKNIEDYVKTNKLKDAMEVIFQLKKEDRKDFYRTIAAGLNRPLFAVYRRVQRMYDAKNYVGKYSALDIEKLKSLRAELGNDWAQIGAKMGRSASSVKDKCRLLKEACHQGKWRFEEEERLTDAVYEVTKTTPGESITGGIPWQQVAEKVQTRTEKQCRAKWLNYLNWKHTGGTEWDKADDDKLLDKIKACNVKDEQSLPWAEMAAGWKSVRSPQWLRSKWWTLKRTVPNYDMYGIPDLVDLLKKNQRRQKLRFVRYPSQLGNRPIKIAGIEVPSLGTIKNNTLTLHLPIPFNQPDPFGALGDSYILSKGSPSGPFLVKTVGSDSGIATISGNQIVVSSLQEGGTSPRKQQLSVQLHQTSSNQLIITTNQEPDEESQDAVTIRAHTDELDHRVTLHDSHLGAVSETTHDLHQADVDHLTNDINQSETDHPDGGDGNQLNSQSHLIGTDAVLSSQQEVTTSELQVVTDGSLHDSERTLVIVRSAPPSEGLVQSGSGSVENSHLENSVFTLSGSLLNCQTDHPDLMDPSTDMDGKAKLNISPQS